MRLGFGAAAMGLTVALAAVALAQDTVPIEIRVDAKVVPNKAGTAQHPQAVRIESHAYITIPEGYDPPLVDTVDVWFPRGGLYNGDRYPKCSQNVLARHGTGGLSEGLDHGERKRQGDRG